MGEDNTIRDDIKYLLDANQARVNNRWQEAIDYYIKLLEIGSNNAKVMWLLSEMYFALSFEESEADLAEKALGWVNKALQADPYQDKFYVTRSAILHFAVDAPDYILVEQNCREALSLNPNSVEARLGLVNLVNVPENVISLLEALTLLEEATLIEPQNPFLFLKLGSLYTQAKRFDDAAAAYRRSLLCSQPLPVQYSYEFKSYIDD